MLTTSGRGSFLDDGEVRCTAVYSARPTDTHRTRYPCTQHCAQLIILKISKFYFDYKMRLHFTEMSNENH